MLSNFWTHSIPTITSQNFVPPTAKQLASECGELQQLPGQSSCAGPPDRCVNVFPQGIQRATMTIDYGLYRHCVDINIIPVITIIISSYKEYILPGTKLLLSQVQAFTI